MLETINLTLEVVNDDTEELMTNRELNEWLSNGYGEIKSDLGAVSNSLVYHSGLENEKCHCDFRVRYYGNCKSWLKPTHKMYLNDCKND